jgi:hypothetical protein
MKKWLIVVLIIGIIFLAGSLVVYMLRIGYCFPGSAPARTAQEALQFRQDCGLYSSRAQQFGGFLVLFIPGVLLASIYWLVQPPKAQLVRPGPLVSFLVLTLLDSLLLVVVALLSYPGMGTGTMKGALWLAGFGAAGYVSLLGIWQWRRWGLLGFQAVTVLLTVYSGANGITLIPAAVAIFSAIYLTLILRPLRSRMD